MDEIVIAVVRYTQPTCPKFLIDTLRPIGDAGESMRNLLDKGLLEADHSLKLVVPNQEQEDPNKWPMTKD